MEPCQKMQGINNDGNDHSHQTDDGLELIPGLPNHIALLCLTSLHPSLLRSVCHSWRRLIYSSNFPPFFALYALLSPTTSASNSARLFFCFDPIASKWESLPSPPSDPPLKFLRRHPSFISRILPIQSLTVSNRSLVLVAATNDKFLPALRSPLGFDPLSNKWFFGPPFSAPRRWCITGSVGGAVYVVSGVGSSYRSDVARSVEKWDVMRRKENEWSWEKMAPLQDGRYSREAVEAVGYNGKLCVVNIKGNAVKEAATYNITTNRWEAMPEGMRSGLNGPAAVDYDNGVMYVVDGTAGVLNLYVPSDDRWEMLIESECLKGVEQIASGRGRVCVVRAGGTGIAVFDVVAKPTRVWMVDPPPDMEVIVVHILPRMVRSDSSDQ